MFVDTHCHLDDSLLADRLPAVLAAARSAGVTRFVVPGVDPAGWDAIMALAATHAGVFAAPGIHPMRADRCTDEAMTRLAALVGQAVAMGEIGLDYSYEDQPREVQQQVFRSQLRLAVTAGRPVLIHCRRAFGDLLAILKQEGVARVGGIMHAFSGSVEVARECVRLGLVISVAGSVTFENAVRPPELVRQIPLEQLVLETDAPDLTPAPRQGVPNEPAFLVETARKVAELKGATLDEVARVTTQNAERLFRI